MNNKALAPYFNTEVTLLSSKTNHPADPSSSSGALSRNSNLNSNGNKPGSNRRTLISNIHPMSQMTGDTSALQLHSSFLQERSERQIKDFESKVLYGGGDADGDSLSQNVHPNDSHTGVGHRPFTAKLSNFNVKRLNRRHNSKDPEKHGTVRTTLSNTEMLFVESKKYGM